MKIEIVSDKAQEINGISKKTGNSYSLRFQEAFYHLDDGQIIRTRYMLWEGAQAIIPGKYELDLAAMLYCDNFGNLKLSRPVLKGTSKAVKTANG